MSKRELVDAYISGTINRRTFVHGLTAIGVSAGVAASYAVALRPAAANHSDFYPDPKNKSACRNGGFKAFGFGNQGRCIKFVVRHNRKDKK